MLKTPPGPTIMGIDVIWVGSILAAVAACAVMFAIYSAITIRDPMQNRLRALNERRDQLKSGMIVSTAKKRASLVRKNDTADKMRDTLSSMKVLQDSQVQSVQQKLAQAGIRKKELAPVVIMARLILPIVIVATREALRAVWWQRPTGELAASEIVALRRAVTVDPALAFG